MAYPTPPTPGTVVPTGSLVTPSGTMGAQGPPGPTAVSSDAGNIAILGSDAKIFVPDPTPVIWSQTRRMFNSVGNPNFEVDQRNVGTALTALPSNNFICDRWYIQRAGTHTVTVQRQPAPGGIVVPGTNFNISANRLSLILTGQESSMAAGDYLGITQAIEGPQWRELAGDVHSISLLVWSSVAPLKFSVSLRDAPATTTSLVKLCTYTTASTWQLITLPNIPAFPAGNWTFPPGNAAYLLNITLACGTTLTAPAADTWQAGSFIAAPGADNWCGKPVNSQFIVAFVQHEPGPVCSTLMDKPFSQNLDECLRYYCKSYDYGTAVGTVNAPGYRVGSVFGVAPSVIWLDATFPKLMAKIPTVTPYNYASGAANSVYFNGIAVATAGVAPSTAGIQNVSIPSQGVSAGQAYLGYMHFTADTGW